MAEVAGRVTRGDRGQRIAHRSDQGLPGAGTALAHQRLHLREGLLDGVVVRRVGRQVQELASTLLDELAHFLPLVGREVVHHHYLSRGEARAKRLLQVGLEDDPRGRPLHRHRRAPALPLRLESSVTFLPQLRGAKQNARSPRLDHAYSGRNEVFVEHSSSTKRPASISAATSVLQAALRNPSRSLAPTDLFFGSTPGA